METFSELETEKLGRSLAAKLRPGDVVLLYGELGAGKTAFARGVARGLGVQGPVASPTFTLLRMYEAAAPLRHFDLYRLAGEDDFFAAGLEEHLGGDVVALVEWPERCEGALPKARLEVRVAYGEAENERRITITPAGGFREVVL